MKRGQKNQSGFSLLEVLIAFAIITIVAASVFIMQSNSLFASVGTRNLMIASNLARGFIAHSETELEGKEFTVLKEEEDGKFPEPYETFSWKREIKEQDFSALSKIIDDAKGMMGEEGKEAAPADNRPEAQDAQAIIVKVFENYLKDSIRTLKITISWIEDGKPKSVVFTTLLVRYDAELRTTL